MTDWHRKKQPPFNDHLGVRIEQWREGFVVISAELQPEYRNIQGSPHGGFIATLIDIAGSYCGVYCPYPDRRRKALTLSLSTSFTGLAKTRKLKAIGRVTSAGRKIYHSHTEVYDGADTLVATGQTTLRYRRGSETLQGEPIDREPDQLKGL